MIPALHMYRVHRMCSKTTTLGGVTISEGTQVVVPIDLLHHNPEHWPDPYKFDPERYVENLILLTEYIHWAIMVSFTYCIHTLGNHGFSHLLHTYTGQSWFLSLTAYIGQSWFPSLTAYIHWAIMVSLTYCIHTLGNHGFSHLLYTLGNHSVTIIAL